MTQVKCPLLFGSLGKVGAVQWFGFSRQSHPLPSMRNKRQFICFIQNLLTAGRGGSRSSTARAPGTPPRPRGSVRRGAARCARSPGHPGAVGLMLLSSEGASWEGGGGERSGERRGCSTPRTAGSAAGASPAPSASPTPRAAVGGSGAAAARELRGNPRGGRQPRPGPRSPTFCEARLAARGLAQHGGAAHAEHHGLRVAEHGGDLIAACGTSAASGGGHGPSERAEERPAPFPYLGT